MQICNATDMMNGVMFREAIVIDKRRTAGIVLEQLPKALVETMSLPAFSELSSS